MMVPFDSIGDSVTRWLLVGSCIGFTAGLVAWHYGKHLHRRWLNNIHPWHSTSSYGHVRTVRPPYDWEKELHG